MLCHVIFVLYSLKTMTRRSLVASTAALRLAVPPGACRLVFSPCRHVDTSFLLCSLCLRCWDVGLWLIVKIKMPILILPFYWIYVLGICHRGNLLWYKKLYYYWNYIKFFRIINTMNNLETTGIIPFSRVEWQITKFKIIL